MLGRTCVSLPVCSLRHAPPCAGFVPCSEYRLIQHNNPDRLEVAQKIDKRLVSTVGMGEAPRPPSRAFAGPGGRTAAPDRAAARLPGSRALNIQHLYFPLA